MTTSPVARRLELRADCARCAALCCVVPALSRSADFAIDKAAGQPCPNLRADQGCGIHAELRDRGFPGCTAYDCFGAGQRVVALTDDRQSQLSAYEVVRDLHELLWYLLDAQTRAAAHPMDAELRRLVGATDRLAAGGPPTTGAVADHRAVVSDALDRASRLVRADDDGRTLRRADLVGQDHRDADLRGADLRGAVLIGADLRGADLRRADLLGADLRRADLRGADLRGALYLTSTQVGSADGDARTRLPDGLDVPAHWAVG